MYKFLNANGSVLLVQRANEAKDVAAFLGRNPRMLPQPPAKRRRPLAALALRLLVLVVLTLLLAFAFFLFGEESPNSVVRPLLTAHQRAQAFRL